MMGMFDNLKCLVQLPFCDAQELIFQTKAFEGNHDNFEIRADGTLFKNGAPVLDYSDEVDFYARDVDSETGIYGWLEFQAVFKNGRLACPIVPVEVLRPYDSVKRIQQLQSALGEAMKQRDFWIRHGQKSNPIAGLPEDSEVIIAMDNGNLAAILNPVSAQNEKG